MYGVSGGSSGIPTGGTTASNAFSLGMSWQQQAAANRPPPTDEQIRAYIDQAQAMNPDKPPPSFEAARAAVANGQMQNDLAWTTLGQSASDAAAGRATQISVAQIGAASNRASEAMRAGLARESNQLQREATQARIQQDAAALAENGRQFNLNIEEQRRQFAEKMGFDKQKFDELARQFNLTTAEGTRQFNERLALDKEKLVVDQRQFQDQLNLGRANAILQAPRGPADYFAYAARLPALQQGGYLGDFLSKAIEASTGQRIGALAAQPVVTNTQLAQGLVGAGAGRTMEPAVAQYLQRSLGISQQAMGTAAPTEGRAYGQPVGGVTPLSGGLVGGTASADEMARARAILGLAPVQQPTGFQSSAQEFGRLDPTLQKLYLSLQSEGVPGQIAPGQTPEDFLAGLRRAAPNFGPSATARLG